MCLILTEADYVFADHAGQQEWDRLRAIEACFDPTTRRRIEQIKLTPGWSCLEVGPGAGSIMRWLASRVGPAGRVLALDINPRFVGVVDSPHLEVRRQDVAEFCEVAAFDLIHTRYVLMHVPRWREAFANLVHALKPGGWLLLEEPDFSTAAPADPDHPESGAVARVNAAVLRLYEGMGIDPRFGRRLPMLCQEFGLENVAVETDLPLVPGGSGVASMMGTSLSYLAERLAATGAASREDVEVYARLAEDPTVWGQYYTTVATWGRRPAVADDLD